MPYGPPTRSPRRPRTAMRVRRAQRRGNGVRAADSGGMRSPEVSKSRSGRLRGWRAGIRRCRNPAPEGSVAGELEWATDLDQVRSQEYLEDTIELLAPTTMRGPWTLMLDVGLSARRDHIDKAALHNYGYPLPSAVPGVLMAQS